VILFSITLVPRQPSSDAAGQLSIHFNAAVFAHQLSLPAD